MIPLKSPRSQAGVLLAVIYSLFFYCAGFGLATQLGDDDVMNITFAWEVPWLKLIGSVLNPFTVVYRPTGGLLYRILFEVFGLQALPFRIASYALLALNIYLVYLLGRRLMNSTEAGAIAAILYTYHGRLSLIYLNNGTLYDVLCGTLCLICILYYQRARDSGPLSVGQLVVFLTIFTAAQNAKEMAAALPAILLAYELIVLATKRTWKAHTRILTPLVLGGALVVGALIAKTSSGATMDNAPYTMTITFAQFISHSRALMGNLVYSDALAGVDVSEMWTIWAVVCLVAALLRSRAALFLTAFAFLAPLPVIFVPYRGFYVMYLPLAAWVGLAAAIAVELRGLLARKFYPALLNRATLFRPDRIALFAAAAAVVILLPQDDPQSIRVSIDNSQRIIPAMRDDILKLGEPLPQNAHVLFRYDRFADDNIWGTTMLCRLLYNDPGILADRRTILKAEPDESKYDGVFDYANGHLVVARRARRDARLLNAPE